MQLLGVTPSLEVIRGTLSQMLTLATPEHHSLRLPLPKTRLETMTCSICGETHALRRETPANRREGRLREECSRECAT